MATSDELEKLLTTSEVADELGITQPQVLRLIRKKKLKSIRKGWMHLVSWAELERFKLDRDKHKAKKEVGRGIYKD